MKRRGRHARDGEWALGTPDAPGGGERVGPSRGLARWRNRLFGVAWVLWVAIPTFAQVPPGTSPKAADGFELTRWAREPMLRSPVALSFDDQGRLYVVETARRSTVDIDIRAHPTWLIDDLANQSVDDLRVFFRSRMSTENSVANAGWLRDLNGDGLHDWQDLTTVKEKVHLLEDRGGTGRADRSTLFAEGFDEEINGVIAGVMPWGEDVFVTVYPDLWRLRDVDGDGVADRKEIVFRGFGVHAAFDGHDLHGLTVGPEGKIYFSVGDNGFSVRSREGRRLHHPNTGGVLRMNPDGSDLEVFAYGLRNPQEIAFDAWGHLFSVDNDGDLAEERERFVYIADGSDSGWRLHWQFREPGWGRITGQPDYNPWVDERMWVPHHPGQPAHITPPLSNYSVGPGSFRFNPGTALSEAYREHFFLIQFPVAKVTTFGVRPKGAGFEMVDEHTFVSGMMASALNFGVDGALYLGDWDGMWSPSGKGSIWKVDDPAAAKSAEREQTKEFLRAGTVGRSTEALVRWLGHGDQRVRQRAQWELVRRGERGVLGEVARSTEAAPLARAHALWGLEQGRGVRSAGELPWADGDSRIREVVARVAGALRLGDAVEPLVRLLSDPEPAVRHQAAQALGRVGDPAAFDALTAMVAENADRDAFLRHAGIQGWVGIGRIDRLGSLTSHPSPAVRLAAVVALRRLGSGTVAGFLADAEVQVRREAVRAIHDDDGIAAALPVLASLTDEGGWVEEPGTMRRILNANLRVGTEACARRLAWVAADGARSEGVRQEALECLVDWAADPSLDRVQGFVRRLGERPRDLGDRLIRERFDDLVKGAGKAMLLSLVRVVLDHRIAVDPGVFVRWCGTETLPADVRARALEWVARNRPERLREVLGPGFAAPHPEVRLAALRIEAERDPGSFMDRVQAEAATGWALAERQEALRLAGAMPGPRAARWIEDRLDALIAGRVSPDLVLDVLEAAGRRSEEGVRSKLDGYRTGRQAAGKLGDFGWALAGGDVGRGREIFRSHPNAQCVRCHDAGGEGQQVGPVLNGIGGRVTREYLLESLVDPSARIADGYATVTVEMRDGEVWDGVRLAESDDALTLRLANGVVRRLARGEIARQSTSMVSAMPPLGEVLTRFELRDLVAYLASWK